MLMTVTRRSDTCSMPTSMACCWCTMPPWRPPGAHATLNPLPVHTAHVAARHSSHRSLSLFQVRRAWRQNEVLHARKFCTNACTPARAPMCVCVCVCAWVCVRAYVGGRSFCLRIKMADAPKQAWPPSEHPEAPNHHSPGSSMCYPALHNTHTQAVLSSGQCV